MPSSNQRKFLRVIITAVVLSTLVSQSATMAKAYSGWLTQNPSTSSTLQVNHPLQESNGTLTITFYDWTDPCNLKFGVGNQGAASVVITSVSVSDLVHEGSGLGLNSTISPGAERDYAIGTCGSSAFHPGEQYTLQVTTATGNHLTFPVFIQHPAVTLKCDWNIPPLLSCPTKSISQNGAAQYTIGISGAPNTEYELSLQSLQSLGNSFTPNPVVTDNTGSAIVTLSIDLSASPAYQSYAASQCAGAYAFTIVATSRVGSGSISGVLTVIQVGAPPQASITTNKEEYTAGDTVVIQIWLAQSAQGFLTITPPTGQPVTYTLFAMAGTQIILEKSITASKPYGVWTATIQLNDYCAQSDAAVTTFTVKGNTYDARVDLSGLPPSSSITLQVDGIDSMFITGAQTVRVPLSADTPHTISVDTYSSNQAGVRYYCPHNTWSVNYENSHTFNYKLQYELSVTTDPANVTTATNGGWFDANSTAQTFLANESLQRPGAQYMFDGWEVDGAMQTENPVSLVMNKPHTAVAKYYARFELTVESPNGLGNPQGSKYYQAGSRANFSVETPIGFLVEQVFVRWIGDYNGTSPDSSIVMTKPMVVHAIWTTSYQQLYILAGLAVIAIATVVLVVRRRHGNQPPKHKRDNEDPEAKTAFNHPKVEWTELGVESHAPTTQLPRIPTMHQTSGRQCRYCGAEVRPDKAICDKCGMPAGYL